MNVIFMTSCQQIFKFHILKVSYSPASVLKVKEWPMVKHIEHEALPIPLASYNLKNDTYINITIQRFQ